MIPEAKKKRVLAQRVELEWGLRGAKKGIIKPSLRISGRFPFEGITGIRRVVSRATAYSGVFKQGENIIDLHMDRMPPRTLIAVVQRLKQALPAIKKHSFKGKRFAGLCTDTPNAAIARLLVKEFGMKVIPIPKITERTVRAKYSLNVKALGYPGKYANAPVKRLVLRL